MISPESLRRYRFFAGLSDTHFKEIAMVAEEITYDRGTTIFEECEQAAALYILTDGSVDLFYRSEEEFHPSHAKEFLIGEINPGEVFGISALIEPYILSATARAAATCGTIKISAAALRKMIEDDPGTGYRLMIQIAKALMERLGATRVQLAAAWSE